MYQVNSYFYATVLKIVCIIRIYHECEGRIENSVQRITIWHLKDGFLDSTLTGIMDFFSCLLLF